MAEPAKTTSAGGVIYRFRMFTPQVLLINDLDFPDWFLPKGHVEEGENRETTAKREIKEEVGLDDLIIRDYLGSFTRFAEEANEDKTEHYFLIELSGNVPHKIEVEQGKNWRASWFSEDQLPKFYIPEHEEIVRKAFRLIK